MQIRSQSLSTLRQQLLRLYQGVSRSDLAPFLSDIPLTKGTVYLLRRRCSKASCRCNRGMLHERIVLTASMKGKTQLWTIAEDRILAMRRQTESYRLFRRARSTFIRSCIQRQNKMVQLIDVIGQMRRQQPL